jgi:hypothetical protein
MHQLRAESLKQDRVVWESLISPEQPHEPLIRVRKNIEAQRFEADFALELKGVANQTVRSVLLEPETTEMDEERLLGSLLSGLSAGQQLDFTYKCTKGEDGNGQLRWRIGGSAHGATAETAATTARDLSQNLTLILGTIKDRYLFVPVIEHEDLNYSAEGTWTGSIRPLGINVSASPERHIGFGMKEEKQNSKFSVIVVPHTSKQKNLFDAVAMAATSCPFDMDIMISVTPHTLSIKDTELAGTALEWLRNGEAKKVHYQQESRAGLDEKDILAGLESTLNNWIKNPSGYKITCNVSSHKSIPASFMSMMGGIFNCPVTIKTEKASKPRPLILAQKKVEEQGSEVIDLQGCCNGPAEMPSIIPSVNALSVCGTDMLYKTALNIPIKTGLLLGETVDRSLIKEVRFSRADRSRHAYCLGATGVGKSTLLYNMIMQDIENKEGVAVADPHGDLFNAILSSIPKNRVDDVVIFDPSDFRYSVGLNFLECGDFYKPVQMNFVINEMIMIFDRLYDLRTTGGPIFEQYMRNGLALILDNDLVEPGTLVDLPSVFEDRSYRKYLLKHCKNRLITDFWTKQAELATGEAQLGNIAPYITSKLNQFTHNAILRPIIGQPKSTINFREVMDKKKILLINLSKGMLGDFDARLLGMLLIGKLFGAAMSRVNLKPQDRVPMFFYIDEFQNFATDSITHILSEARKFSLFMTLANQNLSQLSSNTNKTSILESVIGNVGSYMLMRVGAIDAAKMEAYTKPAILSEDLQELPDFHVVGRLLSNNTPSKPFVFKTLPSMKKENCASVDVLRYASRKNYARLTAEVEKEIMTRRPSGSDDE